MLELKRLGKDEKQKGRDHERQGKHETFVVLQLDVKADKRTNER